MRNSRRCSKVSSRHCGRASLARASDQLLKDLEERAAVTPGQTASVLVLREDGTYDVIEWGPVGDDAGIGDKTSDNEGLSDHDTEE